MSIDKTILRAKGKEGFDNLPIIKPMHMNVGQQALLAALDPLLSELPDDIIVAFLDEPIDPHVTAMITMANIHGRKVVGVRSDVRSPYGNLKDRLGGAHFFPMFQAGVVTGSDLRTKSPFGNISKTAISKDLGRIAHTIISAAKEMTSDEPIGQIEPFWLLEPRIIHTNMGKASERISSDVNVYVAGSLFEAASTYVNSVLGNELEKLGAKTIVPQRDGFEFSKLAGAIAELGDGTNVGEAVQQIMSKQSRNVRPLAK